MKTAIITGIAGQDGYYLSKLLISKGYNVFGITRNLNSVPRQDYADINIIQADITNQNHITDLVEKIKPDEIYNLAAQSSVGKSFIDPEETFFINYTGAGIVIDTALKINPNIRIYQASSSEMIGPRTSPATEESECNPVSPYGKSKLQAHLDFVQKNRDRGFFVCSGILYNHESTRRSEEFVTRKITASLARIANKQQEVLELGNINISRDWGYAKEYVEVMWEMLQLNTPDDFIIATGKTHTLREFIEIAARAVNINLSWHGEGVSEYATDDTGRKIVIINEKYYRPNELTMSTGNPSKARLLLNWESKVSFEELVTLMARSDLEKFSKL